MSNDSGGYRPTPGSRAAVDLGCTCPVIDNAHGGGAYTDRYGAPQYWTAATATRTPHPGVIALSESKPLPDVFACSACPMNQWGSDHQRRGGKGKACKEMQGAA